MKRFLTLSIIVLLATAAWSAKTAQAIWTAGNTTLTFTYEEPVSVGSTYNGQTVSAVWSGTDVTATGINNPGWVNTVKGSLTAVVFKQSFQSVKPTSCSGWFYGCTRLNNIQGITYLTTTNVTDMQYMFEGCSSLTSLNLSSFNTTNVTYMYGMFVNCSSLNSLDISSFNTAKVTEMWDMFKGCRSLTSLDLSSFNTANVKRFGYLFSGCSKLTNLIFPSLDTTNRNELWNRDYYYMFENCSSLKNLELSQCNIPNEFYFDGIPDQCFVYMPAGTKDEIKSQRTKNLVLKNVSTWTCDNCEITPDTGYNILYQFKATTLTLEGSSASTYYRYSNGALKATLTNHSNVTVPKGLSLFSEYNAQAIWTAGNTTLTFTSGQNVAVGGTFGGQTVTNMWVGSNVAATGTNNPGWIDTVKGSVTKVVFDSSFKSVKPTSCYSWFISCGKLTTIKDISNLATTNVTNLCCMFDGCSSLTSLDLSSFNTANVKDMYLMFRGCSSLKNLDMSNFNTSTVKFCSSMFSSVPAQCFVYMPTGTLAAIKNQRSKNLVLKNSSAWTCASCEMTPDTEYDIWYQFKATALSVTGSSATAYCLYKDGAMYNTLTNLANVTIPKGKDKISETFPAMAIWTEGNTTLTFLAADSYKAGDSYNGQTITSVWEGTTVTASYSIPSWLNTVKGTMTKVVFDASFKHVKPTKCRRWFDGCAKLETITDIGNLNTANVTDMYGMFEGCSKITSLDFSNFNTANVTDMSYMFCGCNSFTSLDISNFNTTNVTDMSFMFYGCKSLISLDLSNFNTANVTSIAQMFAYGLKLTYLDLSNFNTSKVTNTNQMFNNVPDQCFVYMPADVQDGIKSLRTQNLVLRSGSNWTCDNCVLADGETLTLPYGFKALDGVTYERSIAANNGNGYTVFLPYDCPIPEGVTAYTLRTDEQSLLGEDKIVFAPIEGDVLEAYNPYLLVNSGNDLTNLNTTVDTQVLPTTTATAEKTFGDMRFTGTMRTISNEEAAGMGAYIMQTGCRWKKVMTTSPSAYIPAYRAYLISPSGEAQTRATLFDGTTVGIDPVAASGKLPAGDDNIYDLQGRCVATKGQWSIANGQLSIATGKLPKGVYITNGHRYVVK